MECAQTSRIAVLELVAMVRESESVRVREACLAVPQSQSMYIYAGEGWERSCADSGSRAGHCACRHRSIANDRRWPASDVNDVATDPEVPIHIWQLSKFVISYLISVAGHDKS